MAVKVPDNRQEHPQRGINDADIVFVQLEGYLDADGYSSTRLVPVFHSKMPDTVEPVRSIRPVDVPLLSPMDAIIGNTGAAKWTIKYVKKHSQHLEAMLSYLATKGTGVVRDRPVAGLPVPGPDLLRPGHHLPPEGPGQADQAVLGRAAAGLLPDRLQRQGGQHRASSRATDGTTLQVPYKGDDYLMGYTYDKKSKRYLRSMPWGPHVLADGKRVSTDNVLVIKAHQHFEHHEPIHDIIDAKGTFYYFHGGKYVTGTWRKAGIAALFTLRAHQRPAAQDGARADVRRAAGHQGQAADRRLTRHRRG